jgi:ABC-2 type transport system ATP-binding protein
MPQPIVDVRHLTHSYGPRVAVNDLSLQIQPGEIFGFLGPNGSGKTTLFRILSTLIPAPRGTVQMFGLDAADNMQEIRQRIGVVFQSPSLDKQLSAAENLRHHGHLYGIYGTELSERSENALSRLGLLDRADDRVSKFSGGMQRRVEIAKGLLNRPQLLLLDEPSTGLDPGARIDLWKTLGDIQATGVTILLTTHLMDEADRCSRLAIMASGKLMACDTPAAMKQNIGGDIITLTSPDPAALSKTLRERLGVEMTCVDSTLRLERPEGHKFVPQLIEAAAGLVDSVSVGKPTLEDVFIRVTGKRFVDEEPVAD